MSFTKVAPAGIGTEPGSSILIGDSLLHSTGIDIGSNTGIGVTIRKHGDATFTGIITASAFFGDGSGLEGVSSSGIGTPLSDDDTSDLNKIYYVNQELSIGSTVTVNHPSSAVASYTHYQDLVVTDDADFIVSDGDTFIPDVLGIRTSTSTASAATGGRIRAGTITNAGANGAPNFPNGLTGTAATFTGNLNVGGVLTYEDVTNVDSVGLITARAGVNLVGNDLNVGSNIKIGNASGIVTATSFSGDGSGLTGVGLGTDGSANTSGIITATAFVPTTGQLSHKNLLINGAMQVDQRGDLTVSNSNASRQYGGPDRFHQYYYTSGEEARYTFKQGGFNDSPYEQGFTNVAHIDVTTADTSIHADHAIWTSQRVEAYNASHLKYGHSDAVSVTLSFWIKSTITGIYSICYNHTNMDERYITTYTVNVANTWEKKTITIPGDTRSGKNISPSNGYGLEVKWVWMSGANRLGNPNEWATQGNVYGSQGVTLANIFSSTSNNLYLTGCQLEVGSVATPFEHRSFGDELRRCHRYFFNIQGANGWRTGILGYANSSSEFRGVVNFPAPMRANPTFTGSTTAMVFDSSDDSSSFNVNTISSSAANSNALYNRAYIEVSPGGMTAGQSGQLEFRASNGFMNFSAEL